MLFLFRAIIRDILGHRQKYLNHRMENRMFRIVILRPLKVIILCLSLVVCQLSLAEEPADSFIENTDYTKLVNTHTADSGELSELDPISHIEFFYWYGCKACAQVESVLSEYQQQHPDVVIRRTPVVLRPSWRSQAYLQAITEQLEADLQPQSPAIYSQCISDCSVFQSYESGLNWLNALTSEQQDFRINQDRVWQTEKMYRNRADLFSIGKVPTIIISETYKVDANQAHTSARMLEIVDFLLSQE